MSNRLSEDGLADEGEFGMTFEEPEGYFKERPPEHFSYYTHKKGEFKLRLVGSHPLWANLLWNAAKLLAEMFDSEEFCKGKRVLELGAGAALPSLICAVNNAEKVVITDYPDKDLIENIEYNVEHNLPKEYSKNHVVVKGHIWGDKIEEVLACLKDQNNNNNTNNSESPKFDIIILSDLIFNHSQHHQLLKTCAQCIAPNGKIYVTFSHHRTTKVAEDMKFFELAAQEPYNFDIEAHYNYRKYKAMFEVDFGPEEVRSMVHLYLMTPKQKDQQQQQQ